MSSTEIPVTLAIIGCGQRGASYGTYVLDQPQQRKILAITEPRANTRTLFAKTHAVVTRLHPTTSFLETEEDDAISVHPGHIPGTLAHFSDLCVRVLYPV